MLKKLLIFAISYFLLGLVMGYVGMQLSCQNPLYACISIKEYLGDPWLIPNTFMWPFVFLHGLEIFLD
jgi:hypothetical protein